MRGVAASVGAVVAVSVMASSVPCALALDPPPISHQRVVGGPGGSLIALSPDGTTINVTHTQVDSAGSGPSTGVVVAPGDELVANPVAAWSPAAQRYLLVWQRPAAARTLQAIAYTWFDSAGIAVGSPGIVAAIEPDAFGHRPVVHDPHSELLTASCSSVADMLADVEGCTAQTAQRANRPRWRRTSTTRRLGRRPNAHIRFRLWRATAPRVRRLALHEQPESAQISVVVEVAERSARKARQRLRLATSSMSRPLRSAASWVGSRIT